MGRLNNNVSQAVKDVYADRDALVDIFERIDSFSQRLEFYIEAPLNRGMMDIITRTMVEVFCIMTIVAKEIRQDRMSKPLLYKYVTGDRNVLEKYQKKLLGESDIKDVLMRLDKLMQEEVLMATAQALKVTHTIDDGVKVVDDNVGRADIEDAMLVEPTQGEAQVATAKF